LEARLNARQTELNEVESKLPETRTDLKTLQRTGSLPTRRASTASVSVRPSRSSSPSRPPTEQSQRPSTQQSQRPAMPASHKLASPQRTKSRQAQSPHRKMGVYDNALGVRLQDIEQALEPDLDYLSKDGLNVQSIVNVSYFIFSFNFSELPLDRNSSKRNHTAFFDGILCSQCSCSLRSFTQGQAICQNARLKLLK